MVQERMPAAVKVNAKKPQDEKRQSKQTIFTCLRLILLSLILALIFQPSHAAEVTLSWDSCNGATGYKIYYGFESRSYIFVVDLGLWTQCTISDLDLGQNYYVAVTAYNDYGESDFSEELIYKPEGCGADLDIDNDVDGSDLAELIEDPSATTISDFAAGFGKPDCDI